MKIKLMKKLFLIGMCIVLLYAVVADSADVIYPLFSANATYGGVWFEDDGANGIGTTISIADTWYNITGFLSTDGADERGTWESSISWDDTKGVLVIEKEGTYHIDYHMSFQKDGGGSNDREYMVAAFLNDEVRDDLEFHRVITGTDATGVGGFNNFINLDVGDEINVRIEATGHTDNIGTHAAQLTISLVETKIEKVGIGGGGSSLWTDTGDYLFPAPTSSQLLLFNETNGMVFGNISKRINFSYSPNNNGSLIYHFKNTSAPTFGAPPYTELRIMRSIDNPSAIYSIIPFIKGYSVSALGARSKVGIGSSLYVYDPEGNDDGSLYICSKSYPTNAKCLAITYSTATGDTSFDTGGGFGFNAIGGDVSFLSDIVVQQQAVELKYNRLGDQWYELRNSSNSVLKGIRLNHNNVSLGQNSLANVSVTGNLSVKGGIPIIKTYQCPNDGDISYTASQAFFYDLDPINGPTTMSSTNGFKMPYDGYFLAIEFYGKHVFTGAFSTAQYTVGGAGTPSPLITFTGGAGTYYDEDYTTYDIQEIPFSKDDILYCYYTRLVGTTTSYAPQLSFTVRFTGE